MKRVLSLVLAVVMLLAMSTTAFATTYQNFDSNPQTENKEVTAYYATASTPTPDATYYFTIEWTQNGTSNLTFTRGTAAYKWDGANMKYVADAANDVKDAWSGTTGYKVTVTNQSNATIFVKTSASNTYNLNLSGNNLDNQLTTAAVNGGNAITVGDTVTQGTAQTAETTYTYTAQQGATVPSQEITDSFTVGTITVKVSNNTIS